MPQPLDLPASFNPATLLLQNVTENGVFHETRKGAAFAAALVANGTPGDLELAERVLAVVLGTQERRADDPHHGNFTWMLEDDHVQDLNAVEFCLERLVPMMLDHADRLSSPLRDRVREAIRLGLVEIARLDVRVAYTNICLLDIVNTCLGGELLGDERIAERGYRKLVAWMAFTDANGAPFEYNSPTYGAVTLGALARLERLSRDEPTRIRARTAAARLGLSAALHIHAGTGRWAGPHSRAYHPTVVGETEPEIELVRRWTRDGTLPAWLAGVLEARPDRFEVLETASAEHDYALTTYHAPAFALGVSSREYSGQSNVLTLHYRRREGGRPGVVYTRYLSDDKWLGDFYHATDRTRSRNLIEEGRFFGVQAGERALGVYAPGLSLGSVHSLKACLIWLGRDEVDEIWLGERRVEALPAELPAGEVLVVGSGEIVTTVWPLARTDLGRDAPARLVERQGDLVLELYSYLGPEKTFWELNRSGNFFQGEPRCGFYLEVADRSAHGDGRAFGRRVRAGALSDTADPPSTYDGGGERRWSVGYARDHQEVGLEVDLMRWSLKRRWTQDGPLGWPMLDSPPARQSASGRVEVGGATLDCGAAPAWLYAGPAMGCYAAGYHGREPRPLVLTVPDGRVEVASMGTGTVVWQGGEVTVDALEVGAVEVVRGGGAA